jgi:hypothetical protein
MKARENLLGLRERIVGIYLRGDAQCVLGLNNIRLCSSYSPNSSLVQNAVHLNTSDVVDEPSALVRRLCPPL